MTSKLSKNTYIFIASLVKGIIRAPLASFNAMDALVLKTFI